MIKHFNIFSRDEKRLRAKARKTFLFVLFAFCLMPFSFSAPKPVTVIVSLSPPYTPFLNEYGASGVDKLQVSLIVNDSRLLNHPGKLQMLIEHVGSGIVMRTSEYAAIAPIMLTGNVTEVFNGFDLNKYFMAQNNVFTGFDQSQYMQTGRIPDGQYRIGFRVVDAHRPEIVLSNTAYTQAGWFVLNDPPQINLPRNKEKVRVNDLQNVKLEWFPRHLGSLNAAFATSYQIELFAIRVPGMNPNQVAMSMQPDFTDVTNRTSYNLTNDKYLLEPGVEYAYRIKAMAGDDQLTLFQNDGYSEVFSFIYGSLCPETENVSAQTLGTDKVEIAWDTDPLQTSFETRFRKAGQVNDAWHTRESFIGMAEISNVLSPGVKYEYQVKATCTTVESDYSALDYFTMPYPPNAKFECGADDTVTVSNTIPKASLQEGEMIFYGQFPIKLTEVSGSNGIFTGKGRMRIPFLANIQVNMQFNSIKVNELNEVYEGELVSIYNPDSKFLIDDVSDYFSSGDQVGNVVTGEESAAITLGYVVDNASSLTVTVTGSTVTVTSSGGTVSSDIETATGGTTISDSEGNLYVVSEDGSVSQVGTSGGASNAGNYNSNSAAYNQLSTDATIEFSNDESDIWAFDKKDNSYENSIKINSEYEQLGDYFVPWKLIPEGKSGKVKAKITSGSIDTDKVVFKTPTGTEYTANYNGSEFEITIVGSEHGDAQEIYALYQENDSTTKSLGKLKTASYNIIKGKLAIVPIGDAELSAETIKTHLDNIYLPYGIEWDVRSEPKFTNMDWAGDDQKLDAGESGFFSAYTAEMKALNKAFKAERTVNDDEVYLFVFNTEAANVESGVLLGDMPIGYQFGYLFSPSDDPMTAKTIAHELAHGKLQLKHTFDASYGLDEGTTANLMDYSSGEELVKQQWDAIFDPQILIAEFLQDDEDGALINQRSLKDETPYIATKTKRDTAFYHSGETIYLLKQSKSFNFFNIKKHRFVINIDSVTTDTVYVDIPLDTIQWNFNGTITNNKTLKLNTSSLNVGQSYNLSINIPSQYTSFTKDSKIYRPRIDSTYNLEYDVVILDNPIIEFTRNKSYQAEYGFDNDFWSCNSVACYDTLTVNGVEYNVPWLSLKNNVGAEIQAVIKISNDQFKTMKKIGHEFKFFSNHLSINGQTDSISIDINTLNSGDNFVSLNLISNLATTDFNNPRSIFALSNNDTVGKIHYFSKATANFNDVELYVVPVFKDSANLFIHIDSLEIRDFFNNLAYNQAYVEWSVSGSSSIHLEWNSDSVIFKEMINDAYKYNWHTNVDRNYLRIISDIKSGVSNQYSAEAIQHFLSIYLSKKDAVTYNSFYGTHTKYLMFITDLAQNGGENGIGVVNGRFSTIFKNGIGNYETYVHEIGHNLGLYHVFDNTGQQSERGIQQGHSEHYMDYFNNKLNFWKTDWEFIFQQTTP